MKKIFALLLGVLSVCGASAQSDIKEPTLPPMENYGSPQALGPHALGPHALGPHALGSQASPVLRMRGMEIDDGYGELSPYGAARLFGGTPAHDDYMNGIRYRRVSAYTLWSGVALSAAGLWAMTSAIGVENSSGPGKSYHKSVIGTGVAMLAVGVPLTAVGATFRIKAKRSIARAVDTYNRYTGSASYDPRTPELSVGFTPGGVGLAYSF